jgi:hypothetical protein
MLTKIKTVKKGLIKIEDKEIVREENIINKINKKTINDNENIGDRKDELKSNDNKNNQIKKNIDLDICKINELLEIHIDYILKLQIFMKKNKYKIRFPNFPEGISENIIKEYIIKKEKRNCRKTQTGGDLEIMENKYVNKIEVKCFTSDGPTSFGPTENWDEIYFLDAKRFLNKEFIIYKINLSNNSETFSNIKINASKTYKNVCEEGKRPRIIFKELKKQLKEYVEEVYKGNLEFT